MRLRNYPFMLTRRRPYPPLPSRYGRGWPDPDEWSEIAWTLLLTCAVCGFALGVVARWAH